MFSQTKSQPGWRKAQLVCEVRRGRSARIAIDYPAMGSNGQYWAILGGEGGEGEYRGVVMMMAAT